MTTIISEQNDLNTINFVAGLSDPGEMIRCGYRPELRRNAGENDVNYANRIRPLVMALPQKERDVIMKAALNRADLTVTPDGKVALAMADEGGWHGVGTVVRGLMTWAEGCNLAHVNRLMEKKQLMLPEGGEAKGMFCVRYVDDPKNPLAAVGSKFTVIQVEEMGNFLDSLVGEKLAMYDTIGSIKGGRVVWASARIPGEYRIKGTEDALVEEKKVREAVDLADVVNIDEVLAATAKASQ